MAQPKALRYVGAGRLLVGIPAADLDPDSLALLAETRGTTPGELRAVLVASGLYTDAAPQPKETPK